MESNESKNSLNEIQTEEIRMKKHIESSCRGPRSVRADSKPTTQLGGAQAQREAKIQCRGKMIILNFFQNYYFTVKLLINLIN